MARFSRSTLRLTPPQVERLEDRRFFSASLPTEGQLADAMGSDPSAFVASRALPRGFLGTYYGAANVTGAGTVTMTVDVGQFDSRHRFMQIDLIYGLVAKPFSGTFQRRNGGVILRASNGVDSLTFSGKLIRNGRSIRITFSENFNGQQYQGTNLSIPRVP